MADNAAHGGARAGAGRKRSGPANDAPEFAAKGKQRTLQAMPGFEALGRRSSSTQPPDDDSMDSASDSPDASESASAAAQPAAPATGQGSPLTPTSSTTTTTTTEQQQAGHEQQADHDEQPDDREKQQRHGDATTAAAKEVKPRGVAKKMGGKSRDEIAIEINKAKGLDDKTCILGRNVFNPDWLEKFPWMHTVPQELSPGQQPDFVGCVACRWLRQKFGMSDAISKCEMPGSSREMRQDKLKKHDKDDKHKRAMVEWMRLKEQGVSNDTGPVLEAGLFPQATPQGIANLIKVAVSTAARLKPLSDIDAAIELLDHLGVLVDTRHTDRGRVPAREDTAAR